MANTILKTKDVKLKYGDFEALHGIDSHLTKTKSRHLSVLLVVVSQPFYVALTV